MASPAAPLVTTIAMSCWGMSTTGPTAEATGIATTAAIGPAAVAATTALDACSSRRAAD